LVVAIIVGLRVGSMSGVLVAIPAVPLLVAMVIGFASLTPQIAGRLAIGASAVATIGSVGLLISVGVNGPVDAVFTNADGVAIVGLTANRIGAILILLTSLVGLIVQSFASRSLLGDLRATRFHALAAVLASAASLVGVAATGSGLLVAWVATSVTLVALLGHKAPWPAARHSQRLTARSFLIGDTALLLGVLIAVMTVGDIDLRNVASAAGALDAESVGPLSALTIVALCLVIAGVARSALVPLHGWLPSTLAAPTPVSALLHAGVINGAGVLLIRFSPVFASSVGAMILAFALGITAAVFATAVMLVRTDVKGGLVWSTSGQMGFMVVQLGVGAFAAALFHIVGHALYKATMFLGAGGAISAHSRQTQRPHLGHADAKVLTAPVTRFILGALVPLASFALALWIIDPHLTAAATILIVLFGAMSVGRAANGWTSATPFAAPRTIATASVGIVVATFGYVGGIAVFEGFIADIVPYEVPAAVGPLWVASVLAAAATGVLTVAFAPGTRGATLRRNVYAWLLSSGMPVTTHRSGSAAPPPEPTSTQTNSTAASELASVGDQG
jgi:NAD(P)H-quinone oxidoreductase subunit 5